MRPTPWNDGRASFLLWLPYRAMRTMFTASSFAFFWSGAAILAWTLLPLVALFTRDRLTLVRRCHRIVCACFRVFHGYMNALRLVSVSVDGPLVSPDGGPIVIIANHTTLVDMTAILSRYDNICCVAKSTYTGSIFVGRLLRLAGFVVADPATAIEESLKRLNQGFHVLVFPEGTRSPPGDMGEFHRGAFEIARRSGRPIVPLLLTCEPSVLTKGHRIWNMPATSAQLRITPKPHVECAHDVAATRRQRIEVQTRYRTWLRLSSAAATAA